MGIICNKMAEHESSIHIMLKDQDDMNYVRFSNSKNGNVLTPTGYLLNRGLVRDELPPFIMDVLTILNNHAYDSCISSTYKDVYFCKKYVYTMEFASKSNYKKRLQMQKIVQNMIYKKYILSPDKIVYALIDGKDYIFQRMQHCTVGEFHSFIIMNRINTKLYESFVHHFVYNLCSALRELHANNIYCIDLKPENIFGYETKNGIQWKFADMEYAFVSPDFSGDVRRHNRWVRTYKYIPDSRFPSTKEICIRNDCFGMARCVGILVCEMELCISPNMFWMEGIIDDRYRYNSKYSYLEYSGDAFVEYDRYANTTYLDKMIDVAIEYIV